MSHRTRHICLVVAVLVFGRPSPLTAESRTYAIAEGTTVEFVGSRLLAREPGGFANVTGRVGLDPAAPQLAYVTASVDLTSLWTRHERLTAHLKSKDFFEAETYPIAAFESTEVRRDGAQYLVTGDLTLHGVTRTLTFPATVTVTEQRLTATAEFVLNRYDFGVAYRGLRNRLIRAGVRVKLHVVASPTEE